MSTSTSKATATGATGTSTSSTVRPGLRVGEHVCAVQFAVWGPQDTSVKASTGGGRGGAPYVVVQVGASLTYAYDQAAIDSYVRAWEAAERMNTSVRLPEFAPASASRRHTGEDLSVLCNVSAEQRSSVFSTTGADGRPVITVTVGAVTVDVHTTSALSSYLAAWHRAATVTGLLEDSRQQ